MMDKNMLLHKLQNAGEGNHFSIEFAQTDKVYEWQIESLAKELESEGKIELIECSQHENTVYLKGRIRV
ncbi:hypothetical protein ACIFOT_07040 [Neobacillus sp. NRS-1170]|uniref:hypothetical protein n=1 Tax=Neobacillus sp. NRS-1170 TaxID=3233898 RepID=UPI003D272510